MMIVSTVGQSRGHQSTGLMQKIDTIETFMSGSVKTFDVYKTIVDEVDTYTDDDRECIVVKTNGESFTGLFNQWVYEYICYNEGEESILVLWRAPKGDPRVSYSRHLWRKYI